MSWDVLVIDPPWNKKKGGLRKSRPNQGRLLEYKTMSTEEIFNLLDSEIFPNASENHCVFMWTVDQYLIECEEFMKNRGYKRHCRFIWDKTNGVAPAFTVRYTHEYLIWYYKPKMIKINKDYRGKYKTIFTEKAREHSRKPEVSFNIISNLYPNENKIAVFSRQERAGWVHYGDEIGKFKIENQ